MKTTNKIKTLNDLSLCADYTFIDTLTPDPKANDDKKDHFPREVFSGHYVPVIPTAIKEPLYITHSKNFFKELGLDDTLAKNDEFIKIFSGDLSNAPKPLLNYGWATGYALSIYGTEYYEQCPFSSGNGYGDGRAISIFEGILNGKRWEMQLKGGGRTPYCRGADGKAVLRSSVREFLAQEHMDSLGVSTSRSLSLYVSKSETTQRPWFSNGSYSKNPDIMINEPVAISTRVASSFLRVGQLELFGRRARKDEHPDAFKELRDIVLHTIDREYQMIDQNLPLEDKIIDLAISFRDRVTSLVANWIRVGYTQGNFNSDNCAIGGFTLDYGPFGFIDMFDPRYQPWTGGGVHFSFLNQPHAAKQNFHMFCTALKPLIQSDDTTLAQLEKIDNDFDAMMENKMVKMWADKLGLKSLDTDLFNELIELMINTDVDYTIFFRELSHIPDDINPLQKSFYNEIFHDTKLLSRWEKWLENWKVAIDVSSLESKQKLSKQMKQINPKYTLREWFLVPAYNQAHSGDYTLIKELQEVMNNPYEEQSKLIEEKYYQKKPSKFFNVAGISHVSCSS